MAGGSFRSREKGPPGARRARKKVIVITHQRTTRKPRNRRTINASIWVARGEGRGARAFDGTHTSHRSRKSYQITGDRTLNGCRGGNRRGLFEPLASFFKVPGIDLKSDETAHLASSCGEG